MNSKAARAVETGGSDLNEGERQLFYRMMGAIAENLEAYTDNMERERRNTR